MSDSEELRKIAQTLLDTSERLRKEAADLTRRAEELEKATKNTKSAGKS